MSTPPMRPAAPVIAIVCTGFRTAGEGSHIADNLKSYCRRSGERDEQAAPRQQPATHAPSHGAVAEEWPSEVAASYAAAADASGTSEDRLSMAGTVVSLRFASEALRE